MTKRKQTRKGKGLKPANPHDSFFKLTFSDKDKVVPFLQGSLPAEIAQNFDFESLRLDPGSYVDDKLRNHFSDLVYDAQYGKDAHAKVALLFEHKSTEPHYPHIQTLRYKVCLWENQIAQKLPLTPIITIIVYHGTSDWSVGDFKSNFIGGTIPSELMKYTPYFEYLLIDLHAASDDEILSAYRTQELQIAFRLMKHIRDKNILELLPLIFEEVKPLLQNEKGIRYIEVIELYLLYAGNKKPDEIKEVMQKIMFGEPPVGSTAWQIQQQGIEKGIDQEVEKSTINMIREGCTNDFIARINDISIERIEEIRQELKKKEE